MTQFVSLPNAKTHLSGVVDPAAAGKETVISKNGMPPAKPVPIAQRGAVRAPANAMKISRIAADFDAPEPAIAGLFGV